MKDGMSSADGGPSDRGLRGGRQSEREEGTAARVQDWRYCEDNGWAQASLKTPLSASPLLCYFGCSPSWAARYRRCVPPDVLTLVVTEVEELNLAGESSADDSESPGLYRCFFRTMRCSYGCFVS